MASSNFNWSYQTGETSSSNFNWPYQPGSWDSLPRIPPTPMLDQDIFNAFESDFHFNEGLGSSVQPGTSRGLPTNVEQTVPPLPQTNMEPNGLEVVVHEEAHPNQGNAVLMPNPVSQWPMVFRAQESTQAQDAGVTVKRPRGRKGRHGPVTSRVIDVAPVSFDLVKDNMDPMTYILTMYDHSSELEEVSGPRDESALLHPHLLKGWTRETRVRRNGVTDKFYSHSACRKLFRSVTEVVTHIKTQNNMEEAELNYKYGFQDSETPSSSSNPKKRKLNYFRTRIVFKKPRQQVNRFDELFSNANLRRRRFPSQPTPAPAAAAPPPPPPPQTSVADITAYFAAMFRNTVNGVNSNHHPQNVYEGRRTEERNEGNNPVPDGNANIWNSSRNVKPNRRTVQDVMNELSSKIRPRNTGNGVRNAENGNNSSHNQLSPEEVEALVNDLLNEDENGNVENGNSNSHNQPSPEEMEEWINQVLN